MMSSQAFVVEQVSSRKPSVDPVLLAVLVLLVGTGIAVMFSSSYFRAELLFADPFHFLRRQSLWVLLGAGAAVVFSRVAPEHLRRKVPLLVLVALGAMLLSFMPGVGVQFLGARRWIFVFGLSFQPSELVKFALVLYLAHILSRKQEHLDDPVNTLLPPVLVVAVFSALIYYQNDFSTAVFVMMLSLAMFFVAGVPLRYFFSLVLMTVPVAAVLLLSREHRVQRLLAFVEPSRDPAGTGYQMLASQSALTQGGFWGAGIGGSTQKFGGLPEAHSDFVFAVLAEELGFLGVLAVVGLFGVFAHRGFRIAYLLQDTFRSYLAFGLTGAVLMQSMLNMAVVSGLVPSTGIPLPFFSTGGSSIFITLLMCGLLLNLSRELSEVRRG